MITPCFVCQDTHRLWWKGVVIFLFTTRGCVCLSGLQHQVYTLPSKSGPVFSSYQYMPRVPYVHTKNRAPLCSGHLAWTISGGLSCSKRVSDSKASIYLSHNDRLAASMLYLVTFLTSPLVVLHICSSHIFSLFHSSPTLSVSAPEGFYFHSTCPDSLPLHAQVYAHRLEGVRLRRV